MQKAEQVEASESVNSSLLAGEGYDFAPHFVSVSGFRLHYVDEGRGTPVLMLHGNPSWSFLYRRLITGLKDTFRVVAPDHIGCGFSEKPGPTTYPFTLQRRLDDISALIDRLDLPAFHLAAHDWGGVIGTAYAVRNPDRVLSLTLFNTAAFGVPGGKRLNWSIRWCRRSWLAAWLILRFNLFAWAASWIGVRKKFLGSTTRKALRLPYDRPDHRIAVLRFVQDIPLEPEHPSFQVLSETEQSLEKLVSKPMLICWGEKDFVFDQSFLAEWIRRFPSARVMRFPAAGHYVLEDEWEQIVPSVKTFLRELEGRGAS